MTYMAWKGKDNDTRIFYAQLAGGGDRLAWQPQSLFSYTFTIDSPALGQEGRIIWTGTEEYLWRGKLDGSEGSISITAQPQGYQKTSSSPAAVNFFYATNENQLIETDCLIAWRDTSGGNICTTTMRNPGGAFQLLTDRATSHGPALATDGGTVYMAWKGYNDEGIYFSVRRQGSQTWSPQQGISGVGTSHSPALAIGENGQSIMVWKGAGDDQAIWWMYLPGDGNTQKPLTDRGTSCNPAVVFAPELNRFVMAWKGKGDDPRIFCSILNGDTWSPQQLVGGVGTSRGPALGGVITNLL